MGEYTDYTKNRVLERLERDRNKNSYDAQWLREMYSILVKYDLESYYKTDGVLTDDYDIALGSLYSYMIEEEDLASEIICEMLIDKKIAISPSDYAIIKEWIEPGSMNMAEFIVKEDEEL